MFCKKCGAENPDDVQFCAKCGTPTAWQPTLEKGPPQSPPPPGPPQGYQAPPPGYQPPPQGNPPGYQAPPPGYQPQSQIPNYLVWSIINIFLCMILGIIATIKSSEVNTKLAAGDYAGAEQASNTAKTLNIIGTILGGLNCIGSVIYFIVIIVAAASSSNF